MGAPKLSPAEASHARMHPSPPAAPARARIPLVPETSYSHSRPKWRFDGMEVRINDAPRANEIMVAIAVTDSRRPLARVGGLTKDKIKGEEGLR